MKPNKEITIYDIAQKLGVSPSTVSRALKDHHSIGKKTKKAVKSLAEELEYKPNTAAASLRNNKTKTIGVIISRINRPFISSLISGIERTANSAGYRVIISQSHDDMEQEIENAHAMVSSRVEGLIVSLAMGTDNYDHFSQIINNGIPIVFVDRVTEQFNSDLVIIDNTYAAKVATQHLIDQGCKRIAHFAGAQHRNVYRNRRMGYEQALKENGLEVDPDLIINVYNLSAKDGYKATEHLLKMKNPPDGIFAPNDTSAVSAIKCAKKMGVRVPDDLAIIGFNDDPICTIVEPELSTISHPGIEMGQIATTQLLKAKDHSEVEKSSIVKLKTELIVRESSRLKK